MSLRTISYGEMEIHKHSMTVLSLQEICSQKGILLHSSYFSINGLSNYYMEQVPLIPPGLLSSSKFHSQACHGSFR